MPSTQLFTQSGGIALVSGPILSGTPFPVGSILMKLAAGAASLVYISLTPADILSGFTSGIAPTATSGGSFSSGGLMDGLELSPGDAYQVDRVRLVSGIESIRVVVPAAASGSRLFWEYF